MFQLLGVHLFIKHRLEVVRQLVQFFMIGFLGNQGEPVSFRGFGQRRHQIPDVGAVSEIFPMADVNGDVQRQCYTLAVASFQA